MTRKSISTYTVHGITTHPDANGDVYFGGIDAAAVWGGGFTGSLVAFYDVANGNYGYSITGSFAGGLDVGFGGVFGVDGTAAVTKNTGRGARHQV